MIMIKKNIQYYRVEWSRFFGWGWVYSCRMIWLVLVRLPVRTQISNNTLFLFAVFFSSSSSVFSSLLFVPSICFSRMEDHFASAPRQLIEKRL